MTSPRQHMEAYFAAHAKPDTTALDVEEAWVVDAEHAARVHETVHRAWCEAQLGVLGLDIVHLKTVPADDAGRAWSSPYDAVAAPRNVWQLLQGMPPVQGVYLHQGQQFEVERCYVHGWRQIPSGGGLQEKHLVEVGTLVVDLDPIKPAEHKKDMASDAEVWTCLERFEALYADITGCIGTDGVDVMFSGNGFQLWLRHDFAAPADVRDWRVTIIRALQALYGVDGIVDPSRVFPLAGTEKRKGAWSVERPYRYTAYWPGGPGRIPISRMVALAAHLRAKVSDETWDALTQKEEARRPRNPGAYEGDGMCARANALDIREVAKQLGMEVRYCPACRSDLPSEVKWWSEKNILKCFNSDCEESWTVLDLVLALGGIEDDVRAAYDWLAARFSLPGREDPSIEIASDTGMWVDDHRPRVVAPVDREAARAEMKAKLLAYIREKDTERERLRAHVKKTLTAYLREKK